MTRMDRDHRRVRVPRYSGLLLPAWSPEPVGIGGHMIVIDNSQIFADTMCFRRVYVLFSMFYGVLGSP